MKRKQPISQPAVSNATNTKLAASLDAKREPLDSIGGECESRFRFLDFDELEQYVDAKRAALVQRIRQYWMFGANFCGLKHQSTRYPIDFDRCCSSAQVLDLIFQISGKTWCSSECLETLIEAIRLFIHPQQNLCSGGQEGRLTKDEVHSLWRSALAEIQELEKRA
jgi:hypothetical protein